MTALPIAVLPHDGVHLSDGFVSDRATRRAVPIPQGDPDAALLVGGFGHVRRTRGALAAVLRLCLIGQTLRPLRWIPLSFRRRHPGRGLVAVVGAVAKAALLPAAAMSLVFVTPALVAGLLVGSADLVSVGVLGAVVGSVSLVAHESAHLLVLRALERDHTVGAVAHSFANVWVVAPPLPPRRARCVALAGPLAGLAVCCMADLVDAPSWLWMGIGVVHVANLLPWAPDGRAVWA